MIESVYGIFEVPELLQQVVVAIAIGGLIGLEREKEPSDKFAGLRTLALLCGSGPVMVYYAELAGQPMLVSLYILLGITMSVAIVYIRFSLTREEIGFTTSVTVFLVSLLGVLVGYGRLFEATSIAIITAFLLAEKKQMIAYVDNLTYQELSDSMKLGALVFILYPILPTDPVGPYEVIQLREVLLFAIFVLLIEFSSYISMRQFGGSKGLQLTGLLAGGANSFATAGVMAKMANQSRAAIDSASSALLLASVSMIVRNVGIASVIAIAILYAVWLPALIMIAITAVMAYIVLKRGDTREDFDIDLDSPFSFSAAAKFAAVYIGITLVSVVAHELFGSAGLYATAFFGGLVSSAAVAVSAATIFNEGAVTVELAGGMVMLGIMASLTSKIVLVETVNGNMRRTAVVPMVVTGVTGILAYATITVL